MGKIVDNFFDRYGKPLEVGKAYEIQESAGPYGQTRKFRGILEAVDRYRGVSVTLLTDVNSVQMRYGTMSFPAGVEYYSGGLFDKDLATGRWVGFREHLDFEHGHQRYIEEITQNET